MAGVPPAVFRVPRSTLLGKLSVPPPCRNPHAPAAGSGGKASKGSTAKRRRSEGLEAGTAASCFAALLLCGSILAALFRAMRAAQSAQVEEEEFCGGAGLDLDRGLITDGGGVAGLERFAVDGEGADEKL